MGLPPLPALLWLTLWQSSDPKPHFFFFLLLFLLLAKQPQPRDVPSRTAHLIQSQYLDCTLPGQAARTPARSAGHRGKEGLRVPPQVTLHLSSPRKVARDHQHIPPLLRPTDRAGDPSELCSAAPESEGVKAGSLLRDFSVICTHVMGIRAVGGSASLWQLFRPMAQHLTRSQSPLIPAVFKFN